MLLLNFIKKQDLSFFLKLEGTKPLKAGGNVKKK